MSAKYWPDEIGQLRLDSVLVTMFAKYRDPATGNVFTAGCERGGHRGRRGWWAAERDESTRAGGYRDFTPGSQEQATLSAFAAAAD